MLTVSDSLRDSGFSRNFVVLYVNLFILFWYFLPKRTDTHKHEWLSQFSNSNKKNYNNNVKSSLLHLSNQNKIIKIYTYFPIELLAKTTNFLWLRFSRSLGKRKIQVKLAEWHPTYMRLNSFFFSLLLLHSHHLSLSLGAFPRSASIRRLLASV